MIMYANRTGTHLSRKNCFSQSVQESATVEYRSALLAPLNSAAYGSRSSSPKLVSLAKHVQQGENKVAETTTGLLFGALSLGVEIEQVVKPLNLLEDMLRAHVAAPPRRSTKELNCIETEIGTALDRFQMRYVTGACTRSDKVEMLETCEKHMEALEALAAGIRNELYGGPRTA